jgi:acyl transferase domain-containing protein/NADPH:quinone reductase-like Zn-dependent oxidoreductase
VSNPQIPDYRALLKRSLVAIEQLESKLAAVENERSEPIAIVGMGCRFPGSVDTPAAYWDLLLEGVDAVTEVPRERWDVEAIYDPDPDAPGKSYSRWGGFLSQVDGFDAGFFGVSPREAVSLDPQQRLLLEVTWEALEHAAIAPSSIAGSNTGVYIGVSTNDYANELAKSAGAQGDAYTATGCSHSIASGRISYFLGLHGPNFAVDTACSSSLVAIHAAVSGLRQREANLALAGGVNLTLSPDGAVLTSRARMMSFDGRCKAFDASADGYVRSEGCGMLVLKRLSDAQRDGDRVLGLIRGSALNQDGRSSGLTAPNGIAQEAVIRAALANARLNPNDIDYVEAHGTGTSLGDPIEFNALAQVYGRRDAGTPLHIGSVKTNIGHLEAASGVAGIIKTVLTLQNRCIPPHLHLRKPNPLIAWDQFSIVVPTQPTEWIARGDAPRRAGVSSFGFSGTNAHMVLEEAPPAITPTASEDAPRMLVLSAQTPAALKDLALRYVDLLSGPAAPAWADIAATAALGRSHLSERIAVVADGVKDAQAKLASFVAGGTPPGLVRGRAAGRAAPEIVFMFTGQGAQYPGMARRLFESESQFRQALEECDRLLAPLLPKPLLEVMFAEGDAAELLNDTACTQPALFAVEYALAQLWRSWGVEPTAVMGHSVGEYVAACLAGVLSLEDGLRLIVERGRLMSALPRDGSMAVVFAGEARLRAALAGHEAEVSIAAVNGPQNTVISGRTGTVETLLRQLAVEGVEAQRLNVSHAFHSPLMESILDRFEAVASTVKFSPPRISVVSNVSGRLVHDELCSPAYWRAHLREAVRFADSIETLQRDGYRVFVEVGPAPTLLGMAQRCEITSDSSWIGSLRKGHDDVSTMLESLGRLHVLGQPIRWAAVFGSDAARRRVTLPCYPFQRESYWHSLGSQESRASLTPTRHGHPLLGGVVASPLRIFQSEIGVRLQPWLADHRIFDFALFPATGFLELALAAAREVLATDAVMLRDVVIRAGLRLPDDGTATVQVIATPAGDGWKLEIFSRAAGTPADEGAAAEWRLHASAIGLRDAAQGPAVHDAVSLRGNASDQLPVAPYYDRLAEQGAQYGPGFRGITSIARGAEGVLGRVELTGSLATDAAAFLIHPALLDACFQLVGIGLPGNDICVPVGLAHYRMLRPGVPAAWCQVVVEPAASETQVFRADVALLDDDGALLAEVRAIEFRRTTRLALQRALGGTEPRDWAYEIAWPLSPLAAEASAGDPGRWLVFADAGGVGAGLSRLLEARGNAVVQAYPGADLSANGSIWHLDPRDREQFRNVLTATAQRDPRPLKGVVFLWPLDETATEGDYDAIAAGHDRLIGSTLHLAQALIDVDTDARLWFVTRSSQPVAGSLPDLVHAPVWGLAGVIASEAPSLRCTRVDLDPMAHSDDAQVLLETLCKPDDEDRVAWRGGHRHVARLMPGSVAAAGDAPVRLEITERGTLENLELRAVVRERPGPGEVEIRVHATGLNFRDVLNALGMYPGAPGPLGNECSGVVTAVGEGVHDLQVGDDVVAMVDRSFATWVIAPAALTVRKPATLTHVEAATIPVAFLTAQYALRDLAGIKKGDRVLVHAITGGVGMAALQLALRAGAEVFGTAGSAAKRELALARGAHHVADSRSLSFAADVMQATGGEGVDIVLNSLAGEFIPESLRLLRRGGRFIEIGKTGIWDAARVAREFPGVAYHPLYLGEITMTRPLFMREMLRDLLVDFDAGVLSPLPSRCYAIERAEDAFRDMGQAKHTGKLVITQRPAPTPRPDASYLVTGGLGALGLACARWLVAAGARNLVLLGRSAPTPRAEAAVAELRASGAAVVVEQADVADPVQLRQVIARIQPPLRGVLHAAGVVDDAMLAQLTLARFGPVMAPKVRGAWNLTELTASSPLDFFVMFSSGAALLGSPGQANYAAANAFMDALAHRSRRRGMTALSINWGSWAGEGMAGAVDERHRRRWSALGLAMIEPEDGTHMLQSLLYANRTAQAAALPLVRAKLPPKLSPFYAELTAHRSPGSHSSTPGSVSAPVDLLASLMSARSGERAGLISAFLAEQVVKVLALGVSYEPDPDRSLMEMGMDSLMAMELRNRIQAALKVQIPVAGLLSGPSLHQLTDQLLAMVGAGQLATLVDASGGWEEGSL